MRRVLNLTLGATVLALSLGMASCDYILDPEAGGDFTIQISGTVAPVFRWPASPAYILQVKEVEEGENGTVDIMWEVRALTPQGFFPPILYGTVPVDIAVGASDAEDGEAMSLEAGVEYRVIVQLIDGREAFRDFTPG